MLAHIYINQSTSVGSNSVLSACRDKDLGPCTGDVFLTGKMGFSVLRVCSVAPLCQLFCDPIDCSQPGSSVHGISQARMLEWVAMPSSGELPDPGIEIVSPISPVLAGKLFTTSTTWEALTLFINI